MLERETKQRWKQQKAGTTEHQLEPELLLRRPRRAGEEDSMWEREKEVGEGYTLSLMFLCNIWLAITPTGKPCQKGLEQQRTQGRQTRGRNSSSRVPLSLRGGCAVPGLLTLSLSASQTHKTTPGVQQPPLLTSWISTAVIGLWFSS